jgi:RHS repeat-associated protein
MDRFSDCGEVRMRARNVDRWCLMKLFSAHTWLTLVTLSAVCSPVRVAAQSSETVEYYASDAVGSIRVVFDSLGNQLARKDFAPFGRELLAMSVASAEGFAGKLPDSESDQSYFLARQYQNRTGRFTRLDDVEGSPARPQSWNRYVYALDDPISKMDPDGNAVLCGMREGRPVFCDETHGTQTSGPGGRGSTQGGQPSPGPVAGGGSGDGTGRPGRGGNQSERGEREQARDQSGTRTCTGSARILQGNSAQIGHPGGFSGDTVGPVNVTADGAAVIPRQWGGRAVLRPNLGQISGTFPGGSFTGVVDTIGGASPQPGVPVQDALMNLNPGRLIIELPGATEDQGVQDVTLTIPATMACPAGTTEVK